MAPTRHPLPGLTPGRHQLEVELASLAALDPEDASAIPVCDRWRTSVACGLWDSARLRLHGPVAIDRVVVDERDGGLDIRVQVGCRAPCGTVSLTSRLVAEDGRAWTSSPVEVSGTMGALRLAVPADLPRWSPERPHCHRLEITVHVDGASSDRDIRTLGLRRFAVDGLGFTLDGAPVRLRAGTVVWHRWCRDREGRDLAWDLAWIEAQILRRLKRHGANMLRIHLGDAPEAVLNCCDRLGLMVQAEWHFFHGLDAHPDSLRRQWRDWIDRARRHPCVVLFHAWNETDEVHLAPARAVLDELAAEHAGLVIGHRDVIHVHKYWWSMFENVGLHFDNVAGFGTPIMVDEFGGNYLDGHGDPGGYPTLAASFLRFLGHGHTAADRLKLQAESHGRIGEYWRRIGAAGVSPFPICGSWEDGNHLFLGRLRDAVPKPTWDACTPVWSPVAASLDLWDRTSEPGADIEAPVVWMNDTGTAIAAEAVAEVISADGAVRSRQPLHATIPAYGQATTTARFRLPEEVGTATLAVRLVTPVPGVERPIVSAWDMRIRRPQRPPALASARAWTCDPEIDALLGAHAIARGDADTAQVLVFGRDAWAAIDRWRPLIAAAAARGANVVLLDIGPQDLGEVGDLQGAARRDAADLGCVAIAHGVTAAFTALPEPESCLFAPPEGSPAWWNLDRQDLALWNGLRGGLAAPACDLAVSGLSAEAVIAAWAARGADAQDLRAGTQIAYVLAGQYAFASHPSAAVEADLRRRVRFLIEDAPALAITTDPEGPIAVLDLGAAVRAAAASRATALRPLAVCGRGLVRTPVIAVDLEHGGRMVLSQAFTSGRMAPGFGGSGRWDRRYDPAVRQFALNLIAVALGADPPG